MQSNGRSLRVVRAEIAKAEKQLLCSFRSNNCNKIETFRVVPVINANEKIVVEEYLQAQESVVISNLSPDLNS